MTARVGLAGLATMGQNLALNIAEKGFPIVVFNRTLSKVDDTVQRAKTEGDLPLSGAKSLEEFVNAIQRPRPIIILVKAGKPVEALIESLVPLLSPGDILIDGGNEWHENTAARLALAESRKLRYLGMGVSGGEEGARHGPALMPGGHRDAYDAVADILQKVAAKSSTQEPCVSYIGSGGAGHYVKMIHNGIEYGDMQLIAETYFILKHLMKKSNEEIAAIFSAWNAGTRLQSYLIEITGQIFQKKDEKHPERHLVDAVLDVAEAKGTGMWTVRDAALRGVPVPTIQAAVDSRNLSAFKADRVAASEVFGVPYPLKESGKADVKAESVLLADVEAALYCSKICSYAQGIMLLKKAAEAAGWTLNIGEIARGWRGGCIIRAQFLDEIAAAFASTPTLANLLLSDKFAAELKNGEAAWRKVVTCCLAVGLPVPAFSASLQYFDAYRSAQLPTNLIQAQRDCFGAHTFRRIDDAEVHHAQWQSHL